MEKIKEAEIILRNIENNLHKMEEIACKIEKDIYIFNDLMEMKQFNIDYYSICKKIW